MILSIWRFCHFSLAAVASLFLIIASLTGAILAFEPITDSLKNYSINNLNEISLKETLNVLDKKFKEVYEIQITNEDFVSAKVLTFSNQTEEVYLNPINGETLEKLKPKSKFFSFFTNLHRSLFFKKIGRVLQVLPAVSEIGGSLLALNLAFNQAGSIGFNFLVDNQNKNERE